MAPSNSEDVSSEESDSDSSYVEFNDSDDEASNGGSNLKSGHCSIPSLTSTRIKLRGKRVTSPKPSISVCLTPESLRVRSNASK